MAEGKCVLLTGAGFTHNFGAPLGSEFWSAIAGHRLIQGAPRVREAVLRDFDFEAVYQQVASSDFGPEEKAAMSGAVADAYEYVDETVRKWVFQGDSPYPVNLYKVQELINRFAGSGRDPGFFFTLNQDLFVERHYYNGVRPSLPGIQTHPEWFGNRVHQALQESKGSSLANQHPRLLHVSSHLFILRLMVT